MKSTDIIPLAVYGLPLVGLLVLSVIKPNAGRIAYALVVFLLVGCGINYTTSFTNPAALEGWAQGALLPFYRAVIGTWLVPMTGLFFFGVATYQLLLALLLLSCGKWVKLGLVGGILFFLAITPLQIMTFPSLIAAATLAFLLSKDYNSSALDLLRAKRHRGQATA